MNRAAIDDPVAFRIDGPLPGPGITVIEASAGTGKTWTLAALVTRFVADGVVPLSGLLAVTFTRMATGELRERVRRTLVDAEAALARRGPPAGALGELGPILAAGTPEDRDVRRRRLAEAVANFDAATIATTHGFCQLVLAGLGSAGDVDAGAELLEDPTDLVREVVADLYLRWSLAHGEPGFTVDAARKVVLQAVANPDATLLPPPEGDALLSRLVRSARVEVGRRLRSANLLTYDQMLERLAATLDDAERGPAACERLRRRYPVVLVDEFQDTDPVQWRALRSAFGDGAATLVLIGDPKQAIYAFRGADVHAYLAACREADHHLTLTDNWRSDPPLLEATDALFSPLLLGHPEIPFRTVRPPAGRQGAGLVGAPGPAPVRVRVVADHQPGIHVTPRTGVLEKGPLTDWVVDDVAADIAGLLASAAHVTDPDGTTRPVERRDVAVLTRTNQQAERTRDALRRAGVAAAISGTETVFATDAATDWLCLLEAAQQPAFRSAVTAVALTPFVGMSVTEVATADETAWEAVHDRVHGWSAVLARHGVAALWRAVTVEGDLPARLLAVEGGERHVTDLGHVAELLHAEAVGSQLGPAALRSWLDERVKAGRADQADAEQRSRRLDSDAEAVQVLTVHGAKGLEFGIVYCPFLWDPSGEQGPGAVVFHEGDTRCLDVGSPDAHDAARRADYDRHRNAAKAERAGEDLRLLYVALTRARHQVVLWWAKAHESQHSPLGRFLLARSLDGTVGFGQKSAPKEADVRAALDRAAVRAGGLIAVEAAGCGPGRSGVEPRATGGVEARAAELAAGGAGTAGAAGLAGTGGAGTGGAADGAVVPGDEPLRVATFDRVLDLRWRRSSYSSIVAAAHDEVVGSEPEDPGVADEPTPAAAAVTDGAAGRRGAGATGAGAGAGDDAVPCPLAAVPRGVEVGTFVHRLLERVDFHAPGLDDELLALARRLAPDSGLVGDLVVLVAGLVAALSTPLAPLLPEWSLRDLPRTDRLDELGFELPLAGGDRPRGGVRTAEIAAALADHLPPRSPLAGYAERLADPLLDTDLRGYLTGSLDLVFRRASRWYVVDYKTNWLGGDESITPDDYRPAALAEEMQRRHYPLQALLYLVALHRYLRWRLAGYHPAEHLGGVAYLFVRGMVGPDTPLYEGHRAGVFAWTPPPALVVALSELFEHGGAAA